MLAPWLKFVWESYKQCLDLLKNRTFRVKILNVLGKEIASEYVVPQGSKIGPLLYIIYANNLLKIIKQADVYGFADDTALVVDHENLN